MHFEIRDTSSVEGTHAQCKRWIKSTRGDLFTAFNKLLPCWVSCANTTREKLSRNETIVPYQLQINAFSACVRILTNWALYETDDIWKEAKLGYK
ncbi:hypothetical protein PHMEG_00024367 [Phytophthora megakarya]|uniref:Uncharacterized protein n=1 Tax=Phytophthora megakarya TaxID=4795 RepID=A0A225VG38_9STRA|nr:hypothetical protein PHMEG_00024367 [Phytophthora megakarya]